MALTRAEMATILDKIRANFQVLDRCKGPHDFSVAADPSVGRKMKCSLCKGELDFEQAQWYMRGLEHGRKAAGANHVPRVDG